MDSTEVQGVHATPRVGADNYGQLRKTCELYMTPAQMAKVEEAYLFAADFHSEQKRRSCSMEAC